MRERPSAKSALQSVTYVGKFQGEEKSLRGRQSPGSFQFFPIRSADALARQAVPPMRHIAPWRHSTRIAEEKIPVDG